MSADTDDRFELTEGEKTGPFWARLKKYLEDELATQRIKNDAQQPGEDTAMIRGHIDCLKGLIALGDDDPITEAPEQD